METDSAARNLLARTRELIGSLDHTVLRAFTAPWPVSEPHFGAASAPLPVLRWLPMLGTDASAAHASPLIARLIADFCTAAPGLAWRQTYSHSQAAAQFLDNYGYTELVGADAPLASQTLACGFLLLGPTTYYPRHRHEAREIYVTLTGDTDWLQGDSGWRKYPSGTIIYHSSKESHAMRTGDRPLLALYVWQSDDLNQTASLDGRE